MFNKYLSGSSSGLTQGSSIDPELAELLEPDPVKLPADLGSRSLSIDGELNKLLTEHESMLSQIQKHDYYIAKLEMKVRDLDLKSNWRIEKEKDQIVVPRSTDSINSGFSAITNAEITALKSDNEKLRKLLWIGPLIALVVFAGIPLIGNLFNNPPMAENKIEQVVK